MTHWTLDLKTGLRSIRKRWGTSLFIIFTLGLGLGATATLFQLINGLLFQPLMFQHPDRIVLVSEWEARAGGSVEDRPFSHDTFLFWKAQHELFESFAAFSSRSFSMEAEGADPVYLRCYEVSDGFFQSIGISPFRGRLFTAEEDTPGNSQVVLLSYAFWQRAFGGDPDLLNQEILLDGSPYQVIGITPKGFRYPSLAEAWTPLAAAPTTDDDINLYLTGIGLLAENVERQVIMDRSGQLLEQDPEAYPTKGSFGPPAYLTMEPLVDELLGNLKPLLWGLLGGAGFLLLVAFANAANILLARNQQRMHELGIRTSLGARPFDIVRQLSLEGFILTVIGLVLGLVIMIWGSNWIIEHGPLSGTLTAQLAARSMAGGWMPIFLGGLTVLVSTLLGVIPAFRLFTQDVQLSLKGESRTHSARVGKLSGSLVALAVGLSCVLLIASSHMFFRLNTLINENRGFDYRNVATVSLTVPEQRYPDKSNVVDFQTRVLEEIRRIPGVSEAGVMSANPLENYYSFSPVATPAGPPPAGGEPYHIAHWRLADDSSLQLLDVALREGRLFAPQDGEGEVRVAVITESFARAHFPDGNALGSSFAWSTRFDPESPDEHFQVIGIVADIDFGLPGSRADTPSVFYSMPQNTYGGARMSFLIKTKNDPEAVFNSVRQAVWTVDDRIPMQREQTMLAILNQRLEQERFVTFISLLYGVGALVLAGIGLYAVIAFQVTKRTREIGIRIALGATFKRIVRLVLRDGLGWSVLGLLLGLGLSIAVFKGFGASLFGLATLDWKLVGFTFLVLGLTAGLACLLPALRATRLDPLAALREE